MTKKDFLLLLVFSFITIGLISSIIFLHITSIRKLNKNSNDIKTYGPLTFLDFTDAKVLEEEKWKKNFYENFDLPKFSPSLKDIEKENKKNLRSLAESNIFDNVGFVDPLQDDITVYRKWIFNNAKLYSSNIILYPYAFDYNFEDGKSKHFSQGAYISLKTSELDLYKNLGIKTNGTLSIKKARALYNTDIAILNIKGDYSGNSNVDYFSETNEWVNYILYISEKKCFDTYEQFLKAKEEDSSKALYTKINEADIKNGVLMNDDFPRFGILVIPDFLLGTYERIKSALQGYLNKFKEFYEKGGVIIANGKSTILLEDIGLVKKGTYNRDQLLQAYNEHNNIKTKGCESTYNKTYNENEDDFDKQMACFSMNQKRLVCLAQSYLTTKLDPDFKKLIDIDDSKNELKLKDVNNGFISDLTDEQRKILPLVSVKKNDKNGKIILNNFNPICYNYESQYISRLLFHNLFFLALTKEIHITSKVYFNYNNTKDDEENKDLPIPAGEANVQLVVDTIINNINNQDYSNGKLFLFLAENFGWAEYPNNCKLNNNKDNIPKEVKSKINIKYIPQYMICEIGEIKKYDKINNKMTISINNYKATQSKYEVLILEPIAYLIDNKGNKFSYKYQLKINCESAPNLRVSGNPDPSSFYPLLGEGQILNNVIKVENKEESKAYNVEYVDLIPIITPLLNFNDQRITESKLKIYADYYNSNQFEVPLLSENGFDYINTPALQGKGIDLISEWDSPVKPVKELINQKDAEKYKDVINKENDIIGINQGMITINKNSEIIRQINYRNGDRYYKLASQRLMAFVDDSTPNGAKTLNIIGDINKIDPILKDRAKKDYIFLRNDIFFYDNINYVNPKGINENTFFSVDKLIPYNKENCKSKRENAESTLYKKGYFDNKNDEHKEKILEPNVYTNAFFNYCNLNIIDPTNEKDIIKNFGNLDYFRPVHYIVPEKYVTSPLQLYDFIKDDEYTGHHKDYPYIKFIHLHTLNYIIQSSNCLYGGKIILNLFNYKINSTEDITISPDQIAVYKKEYFNNNNTIFIYFRRGLMPNEQFGKKLNLNIYIENLKNVDNKKEAKINVTLEEMKFELSFFPEYERYYNISTEEKKLEFISAFSYPALEIKSKLNRNLNGYEILEPFSRYGIYNQELGHRYIYGKLETHLQSKPGLVTKGNGFSFISNLGISSIPFIEYMTVGNGQLIPGSPSTSRVSWKDIWGRTWHQPIRSYFLDATPIPPPLKNFMMTTTYQLIRNENERIYEWPSDENIKILLKVKLLNNYPKYFEITRCKENKIRFIPKNLEEGHEREFSYCSAEIKDSELPENNNMFLREGGYASYGSCYTQKGTIVGGKKVEGELLEKIKNAKLCADYTDPELIAKCEKDLANITIIKKREDSFDEKEVWNYSPLVESYYPKGYIHKEMWDLTHFDYSDDNIDKGYRYHMDNVIPNYDNGILKPQNTITIPIYKGLGYSIEYNNKTVYNYHNMQRTGWWNDNLQNRDDTILGGQEKCNNVSIGKDRVITNWVDTKFLVGNNDTSTENVKKIIEERKKNIYVCLFDRKRPQFSKNSQRKFYARNINYNNIIPIFTDLEKDDERLTKYNCNEDIYYVDSATLYKLNQNYLETSTSRDYLYFAANLRGHAKESFNILFNLNNFNKIRYEGMVKVNEGGRFVYWNPCNGPNSFLVVDNPASIIQAKRNDIELSHRLLPSTLSTFKSTAYYMLYLRDEDKINKIWPYSEFYDNSYGYEDFSFSVFIGGIKKSKPIVQPGNTTYVKLVFTNNCGFDWNMFGSAIDFEDKAKKGIKDDELLKNKINTIKNIISYNFLNYSFEEDLKKYISISPSDHINNVASEFFDFKNINVATIRDGFKGEYYLKITIDKNFPDEYKGKPIEIKIILNTSYFDHFPKTVTDLVKDYRKIEEIKIPSIYIAVPYNDGEFKGKVLYTSAQASDIQFIIWKLIDVHLLDVKYMDKETWDNMTEADSSPDPLKKMDLIWEKIDNNTKPKFYLTGDKYTISFKDKYPLFPKIVKGQPDIAEMYVIFKFKIDQITRGETTPLYDIKSTYKNWIKKEKTTKLGNVYSFAEGPWIQIFFENMTLVEQLPNGTFVNSSNQKMTHDSEGILQIVVRLVNIGFAHAYNASYTISLKDKFSFYSCGKGIKNVTEIKDLKRNVTNITLHFGTTILAQWTYRYTLFLNYSKLINSYNNLTSEEIELLPKKEIILIGSSVKMNLNPTGDEVFEYHRNSLSFAYQNIQLGDNVYINLIISGRRKSPNIKIIPVIKKKFETSGNIVIDIVKEDLTEYKIKDENALSKTYLIKKDKISNINDKPNIKEISNKHHIISYSLYLYNNSALIAENTILYIQEDVGLSTSEVILLILSILCFAVTILFIFLSIKTIKIRNNNDIFKEADSEQIGKLLDY